MASRIRRWKFKRTSSRQNCRIEKLENLVQNQSIGSIVSARPTAAPRNGRRDNAVRIMTIWWTSPPPILQIHSLHHCFSDVLLFYPQQKVRKIDHVLSTCVLVGLKDVQRFSVHLLLVSFRHCRPLVASQVTGRKDMEVPHKFKQPLNTFLCIFCVSLTHQKHAVLQGRSNCVACWQVSFGVLWTVSQASLTDFTTYLPVKAPVKLTNSTICARWKSSMRRLHKRVLGSILRDLNRNKTCRQKRVQLASLGGWVYKPNQNPKNLKKKERKKEQFLGAASRGVFSPAAATWPLQTSGYRNPQDTSMWVCINSIVEKPSHVVYQRHRPANTRHPK